MKIGTRWLLSAFALALFAIGVAHEAAAERRAALVIGNAQYINTVTLPNVENDAPAMAAALRRLGFEVIEGVNVNSVQMNAKLKEFSRILVGADVGLFFYAGHGMQVAGENYLIPVDATLKQESDLDFEAVKVDSVLKQMLRETRVKIVLLDACRDNPLAAVLTRSMSPRSRSVGGASSGLAPIDTSNMGGTVIGFATAQGSVALDGVGSHSPFTQALLEHMETPGLDIDLMMKRVRGAVFKITSERQQPWTNSSLNGDFSLAPTDKKQKVTASLDAPAMSSAPTDPAAGDRSIPSTRDSSSPDENAADVSASGASEETQRWAKADEGGKPADYEGYLAAYPQGRFATTAKKKIEQLKTTRSASTEPSPMNLPAGLETVVASKDTERNLKLSSEEIRDLHTRLILLGFKQGGVNSSFSRKSRVAISGWQSSEHLVPTGYFNGGQVEYLKAKSQKVYDNWVSQNRPALISANDNGDDDHESRRRHSHDTGRRNGSTNSAGEVMGHRAIRAITGLPF